MASSEIFDPNNVKKEDMVKLGKHIEEYLLLYLEVMIIPDEMKDECDKKMKEGIKRTRKLIEKLKKGKRSVFKYVED